MKLLSALLMMFFLFSCNEKDDDDDLISNVVIPSLSARCKYQTPSAGYCDGTSNGSGGMNTNKGIVYIFLSSTGQAVAAQIGSLICGDAGGSRGVHCVMETNDSDWINPSDLSTVSELAPGNYTYNFQLDKNGDVSSYSDIGNFTSGDTTCSTLVKVNSDTTTIEDSDATLFTCATIP